MSRVFNTALSCALALTVLTGAFTDKSAAMSVEPMVVDITPAGNAAKQSFKVTNTGANPLPIEAVISTLELGPNGEQTVKKAGDDLLIFPPQAMIAPGASQVFRVQWVGDPEISKSKTYRVSVGQVPVKLAKGKSGIQIVMSFGVTVNVAPLNGKSAIVVTKATTAKDKSGKRVAAVTVKNPGNKHAYLQKSSIKLSGGGWSKQMTSGEISQKVGLGIVQPGKERRFLIPVDIPAGVSDITASIDYRPNS